MVVFVDKDFCWNIPHEYGNKVNQVLVKEVRTGRTPNKGLTGIPGISQWYTPSMSDPPETLNTNLVEQPQLKQETEWCRQGCPITPDTSVRKRGSCILDTETNEKRGFMQGVK
jgi:hypothetical protein